MPIARWVTIMTSMYCAIQKTGFQVIPEEQVNTKTNNDTQDQK